MQHDEDARVLDPSNFREIDLCGFDCEGLSGLVDVYADVLAEIDSRLREPTS